MIGDVLGVVLTYGWLALVLGGWAYLVLETVRRVLRHHRARHGHPAEEAAVRRAAGMLRDG